MQPREIQAMNSLLNQTQMSLQELQNHHHHQHMDPSQINHHFDPPTPPAHDDFLDQMLSSVPSSSPWPDIPKSPWDLSSNTSSMLAAAVGLNKSRGGSDDNDGVAMHRTHFDHDQSALLAAKLQIGGGATSAVKNLLMQQQMMLQSRGFGGGGSGGLPSPNGGSGDSGLMPMPLSLGGAGSDDIDVSSFKSPSPGDGSVQALFNGFSGSLHQTPNPQFQHPQGQSYGGSAMNQAPAASGSTGGASAQPRQRVRARRGQATDPHSIAERLRRERIAERMKALQELVPNANKTDKASMLDEIIDYVKFLQLQVKVLSMSRLGGASAVAPLVADMSSEGGRGGGRGGNGNQTASTTAANDTMTVTEHQVAKLMEEDMGTAMQYLQGKGLCLMPISLANAISTATCRNPMASAATTVNPLLGGENGGGPTSPSLSALTVQSATMGNGGRENPGKDSADP